MISARNQLMCIVILMIFNIDHVQSDSIEICSAYSGRRIYLDQNKSGTIRAVNVTASTLKNVRFSLFRLFLLMSELNLKRRRKRRTWKHT